MSIFVYQGGEALTDLAEFGYFRLGLLLLCSWSLLKYHYVSDAEQPGNMWVMCILPSDCLSSLSLERSSSKSLFCPSTMDSSSFTRCSAPSSFSVGIIRLAEEYEDKHLSTYRATLPFPSSLRSLYPMIEWALAMAQSTTMYVEVLDDL